MGIEPGYNPENMVDEPGFIEKIVVNGAKSQCYAEAMTGEVSKFEEKTVQLSTYVLTLTPGSARVQVNLEVDSVLHGWTKALSLMNYLLDLSKIVKHKYHLVLDQDCQTCGDGENKWDPIVHKEDMKKALVKYETRVIKKTLKLV